jgi:dihydropteroate synthase
LISHARIAATLAVGLSEDQQHLFIPLGGLGSKIYEQIPVPCLLSLTRIGKLIIGPKSSAKVMGIINVSPESFFKGSVRTGDEQVAAAAKQMERDGAHMIDIGAMSTAPYLETMIPVDMEVRRITSAIKAAKSACDLHISADTPRAETARTALAAGADVINDVTGLKYDPMMADVIAKSRARAIICAYSRSEITGRMLGTAKSLRESRTIARKAGINADDIIIDPSIGFFRPEGKNFFFSKMTDMPWYVRDMQVISHLSELTALKKPICISVSRKSFIGHLLNLQSPEDRMVPSIACELISVLHGASLIRTHNVKETVQALTMLELLRA